MERIFNKVCVLALGGYLTSCATNGYIEPSWITLLTFIALAMIWDRVEKAEKKS